MVRRSKYDPFAAVDGPSWLVVRDATAQVVAWLCLEPRVDVRAVIMAARDAVVAAGGRVEDEKPVQPLLFFRTLSEQRFQVNIQFVPPANPISDWPLPQASVSVEACVRTAG